MEPELLAIVAGVGLWWWRSRDGAGDPRTDGGDELAEARDRYVSGELTHAEFEQRAELLLDPAADEIRRAVERVGGVGPATSAAIAHEFGTVAEVRRAEPDRLAEVHGVGPSTAEAIADELR